MPEPRRAMRLDQLLSRYGYCSRREAVAWTRAGRILRDGLAMDDPALRVDPESILIDGQPVQGVDGILAMLNKPVGYVSSHDEHEGPRIYDLLPRQWLNRNPVVTSVGRLDKDTSGLLLLTDIGPLVHRWTSPRHHVPKVYNVTLDRPLQPEWQGVFASGTLQLAGERGPCRPATLTANGDCTATLTLTEGKFRQVRRMFEAVGATVVALHRTRFGEYELGRLPEGQYQLLPLPCTV